MQKKTKAKKEHVRTIEQRCSVCKKTFDMPVVEESENQDVLWLNCPGCRGYLPYMVDQGELKEAEESEKENAHAASDDLAIEDLYTENAREYQESNEYEVGEVIYHRSWNDYGKVIAKETFSGHRKTILVHFVNQGKIRLLEGMV
jgi:Zn-finger nucleic acid-binding protein